MNIIEVENLHKQFTIPQHRNSSIKDCVFNIFKRKKEKDLMAIEELSFSIKKGEFFGIIGKNGSGKSTLLRMLANIYKPTKGNVKIQGRVIPFLELGVGFNPELTGRENIYLNGLLLGLAKSKIDENFTKIVEFSELSEFIDQKVKKYSTGMQVRLAFSIAIQVEADIILLDEVLAVGDLHFQKKCLHKIKELKDCGKTIVFVSHDLNIVKEFCDRVLFLENGKMVDVGDADKVVGNYQVQAG